MKWPWTKRREFQPTTIEACAAFLRCGSFSMWEWAGLDEETRESFAKAALMNKLLDHRQLARFILKGDEAVAEDFADFDGGATFRDLVANRMLDDAAKKTGSLVR